MGSRYMRCMPSVHEWGPGTCGRADTAVPVVIFGAERPLQSVQLAENGSSIFFWQVLLMVQGHLQTEGFLFLGQTFTSEPDGPTYTVT
jgi:hypothetical protein